MSATGYPTEKLLSLRYLIPDIPWHTMQSTADSTARLGAWIQRLIRLALRAASSALPPLSTPQETGLGTWTHLHRHAQLSVLTADLPASAGMQQVHHSRSMSSPHGAAYKFAAVRSRGGYISLYDAAAADEGDFGEEAFPR